MNKRSIYQLLELYFEDYRGNPNKYKISSKSHSNLFNKKFIPLYLEEIKFAVLRCGWKVTKLYKHYYFDQERCKRNFILMNQKARQQAPDKVESDFCKLLNNANFGYDCRNNLDNCTFQPINDEINELSFIKRYHSNLYDKEIEQFITSRVLKEDIDERFNNERQKIKETDKFLAAKVRSTENRRNAENEALENFKRKERKQHKKTGLTNFVDRFDAANKNEKVKSIIDFSDQDAASIKALSIKTNDKVKITTRFMKGKMLMFSKLSLRSFVYDIIDIFCFPDLEVKEIYDRHKMIKTFVYLILTDTDSCSLQFTFITELESNISEDEARKLIFEILLLKKGDRLDTSDEFFDQFFCRNESTKKQVGLYEVENIDNATLVVIAVNPKQYIEIFKNKAINKKHKGIKKTTPGMDFESFASRIMDVREWSYSQKRAKTIKQTRFSLKRTDMRLIESYKTQFAGLNDKRYYLTDGVTSLPYGQFLLVELDEKKNYEKIQNVLFKIKDELIRDECKAIKNCERIRVLRTISNPAGTYYKLDSAKRPNIPNLSKCTKDYIISGIWQ